MGLFARCALGLVELPPLARHGLPDNFSRMGKLTPIERMRGPSEMAAAEAFHASQDSSYMADSEVFVDVVSRKSDASRAQSSAASKYFERRRPCPA